MKTINEKLGQLLLEVLSSDSRILGMPDKELAKEFLNKGADVNEQDKSGNTALILAAKVGYTDMVEELIKKGANVNAYNYLGHTPLISGIKHKEVVKLLIKAHVDLDFKANSWSKTALACAVSDGNKEIVSMLISAGCNVNADININAPEPLIISAVKYGNLPIVTLLLKGGANVDLCDLEGQTALMQAVAMDNVEMVKLLLFFGADVNAVNNLGRTALMFASYASSSRVVKLLLKAGAKTDIKDKMGFTALRFAKEWRNNEIVEILSEY